jgi:hypothetical protein
MCPQNADDPPPQCRERRQQRPVDAEEISKRPQPQFGILGAVFPDESELAKFGHFE